MSRVNSRTAISYNDGRIQVDIENFVGSLTFNSPDSRNAISVSDMRSIPLALSDLVGRRDLRALVLQGAGVDAFVAGADLSEFGEMRGTPESRKRYEKLLEEFMNAWDDINIPVIAKIDGYCIGFGMTVALLADIRICSVRSSFSAPPAKLGVGYGLRAVDLLVESVGPARAAEILFTAGRYTAAQALEFGLVNTVVDDADIGSYVSNLVTAIASNAPLTVAQCKVAIRQVRRESSKRDTMQVSQMIEACFESEDHIEGLQARAERRQPRFSGN